MADFPKFNLKSFTQHCIELFVLEIKMVPVCLFFVCFSPSFNKCSLQHLLINFLDSPVGLFLCLFLKFKGT